MLTLAEIYPRVRIATTDALHRGVSPARQSSVFNAGSWYLLAVVPLMLGAVYMAWYMSADPHRLRTGDDALTELFTWHAAHGTLLEGAHSHYGFQFPGPLQFYCMAPFYALSGENANAIIFVALLVNLVAVLVSLYVVRRSADSAAALLWAVVFTCYQAFLSPQVTSSPSTAWLVHLPFAATILVFAAVAMGRLSCLPAALLGLSFVVQTHLAYALSLAVVMAVSLLLWTAPQAVRSCLGIQRPRSGRLRIMLPLSLAILLPIWLPTLLRETTLPTKNFELLLHYLGAPPQYTWSQATVAWMQALAALPRFFLTGENWPQEWPMRNSSDFIIDAGWLFAQVAMLAASYSVARRNRQDFDCVMALLCAALLPATLVSIHCIKANGGFSHLVFWAGSVSLLLVSTFLTTVCRWLWGRFSPDKRFVLRYVAAAAVLTFLSAGCVYNSGANVEQLTDDLLIEPNCERAARSFGDAARDMLRRQHSDRCLVCITDAELWPSAAGLVVNLTKSGISTGVERPYWTLFGAQHAGARPGDGKLLLGSAAWASRVMHQPGVEMVAESKTSRTALVWRRSDAKAEGDYSVADLSLFATEHEGFAGCERDGDESFCWSDASSSRIVVRLLAGHRHLLTIRAAPLYVDGKLQVMTVLLNRVNVGLICFRQRVPVRTTLELPAQLVKDENEIVFRYDYTARPIDLGNNGDQRELAVQFRGLKFERLER